MLKKILIPIVVFFAALSCYSQSDYRPAYIQLTKTDTLFGFIDFRGDMQMSYECNFKENCESIPKIYSPDSIYGYKFIDGKYFVAKTIETLKGEKVYFLEFLLNGDIDLFYYRDHINHYFIEKEGEPIKEITYDEKYFTLNDQEYARKSEVNIPLLLYYTKDCPQIHAKVKSTLAADHKVLIELLKKYHAYTCPNEVCIIYEKSLPKFRLDLEPVLGFTGYSSNVFLPAGNSLLMPTFGIYANFWMPLTNERLFLRTGFVCSAGASAYYSSKSDETFDITAIRIPFVVQYAMLNRTINPTFGVGINNHFFSSLPSLLVPTINAGINLKLNEKLYLRFVGDIEFSSRLFLFRGNNFIFYSGSFITGLNFIMD